MVHYTFENNIITIRTVFHTSLNPKKWEDRYHRLLYLQFLKFTVLNYN
jgi:hypothetical protein